MKKLLNILIFASFIFLFIYLLKQDYIIPEIKDLQSLVISFILLFAGFTASGISWRTALKAHHLQCSVKDGIISHGISVFAKYIPGKIWVILGRAGYISKDKEEMKINSFISFKEQIVYTWAGFLISSIPTIMFYKLQWISIIMLLIILGISLFLFSAKINLWILKLIKKIFKREPEIPVIKLKESYPMIIAVSLIWVAWTSGFYFFMKAFSDQITLVMIFAFPLSVCFGLLAIISPGGIGVREGVLIGYLTLSGLDVETSTTISFLNRLWFVCGEVFVFLLAWILKIGRKKNL